MKKRQRTFAVMCVVAMVCVSGAWGGVSGHVTDTGGDPVIGAQVTFIDEADPDVKFTGLTDGSGQYAIDFGTTGVDEATPRAFSLGQNYPNPFNPTTTIPFVLDARSHVTLSIYNITGQRVATIVDAEMGAGHHTLRWNGVDETGNHVSAGVYLYRLRAGGYAETKKMLLLDGGAGSVGSALVSSMLPSGSGARISAKTTAGTFTVTITHEDIVPYEESGVVVDDDDVLDFVVELSGGPGGIPADLTFVTIPGGTFQMGDVEDAGDSNEKPVHTVTVSTFEMSVYEITNAQYAEYLNDALSGGAVTATSGEVTGASGEWSGKRYNDLAGFAISYPDNDCKIMYNDGVFSVKVGYEGWPVTWVSWYGAKAFAEHYGLDLPREAEWEYASRWGDHQYMYGTDNGTLTTGKANYRDTCIEHPVEVGGYPANPYGLWDMSGNVWEWCNDWYDFYYYDVSPLIDPTGPTTGDNRVIRGGFWNGSAGYCRSANRERTIPTYSGSVLGFRVVRRAQ